MTQVIDLTASILPGKSLAGITLGTAANTLIPQLEILAEYTEEPGLVHYEIDSVDIWVKDGVVVKLAALDNYTGKIDNQVGIGSTVQKTFKVLGPLAENKKGEIRATQVQGLGFGTDGWIEARTQEMNLAVNLAQEITEICIFNQP